MTSERSLEEDSAGELQYLMPDFCNDDTYDHHLNETKKQNINNCCKHDVEMKHIKSIYEEEGKGETKLTIL